MTTVSWTICVCVFFLEGGEVGECEGRHKIDVGKIWTSSNGMSPKRVNRPKACLCIFMVCLVGKKISFLGKSIAPERINDLL